MNPHIILMPARKNSKYSLTLQKIFRKNSITIGSRIKLKKGKNVYSGILMPRVFGEESCIVLKLDNGYNIGIEFKKGVKIEKA